MRVGEDPERQVLPRRVVAEEHRAAADEGDGDHDEDRFSEVEGHEGLLLR